MIQYDQPRVVVLDYKLPGFNGLELCQRIRQVPWFQSTYVIMITAYANEEERIRSSSHPPDELVLKPFRAGPFIQRVKELMARSPEAEKTAGAG
jgi:DNA-binding response OmpR family regulator